MLRTKGVKKGKNFTGGYSPNKYNIRKMTRRREAPGQGTGFGLPLISEIEFIRASVLLAVKLPSDMRTGSRVIHWI